MPKTSRPLAPISCWLKSGAGGIPWSCGFMPIGPMVPSTPGNRFAACTPCKPFTSTTTMALIIDAMDLLHGEIPLDGFCLISSDSDFAPLAIRLRQHGKLVFGIGQHKAISGLQNACHHFVMLDQPVAKASKPSPPSSPAGQPGKIVTAPITQKRIIHTPLSQDPALQTLLQDAFDKQPKQQWEWLDINKLDSALKEHLHYQSIRKQFPSLSKMLMALNYLELGGSPPGPRPDSPIRHGLQESRCC